MFSFLTRKPEAAVALTAGKAPSYIEKQEFAENANVPDLVRPTDRHRPARGAAIEPTRLNPAWTDLTESPIGSPTFSFRPVQTVRYDWVLTSPALHLIVGLERPWDHPEAFGFRSGDPVWRRIATAMEESGRSGHPTLVCSFGNVDANPLGHIESTGLGLIGGELVYQNDGRWLINNNSGRFGVVKKLSATAKAEVLQRLENEARQRHQARGVLDGTAHYNAIMEMRQRFGETSSDATDEDYDQHVLRIQQLLAFVADKFHREAGLTVMTQRLSTHTGLWGDAKRFFQGWAAQKGYVSASSSWLAGR